MQAGVDSPTPVLADPTTPSGPSIRERGKADRRVRIVDAAVDLLTAGGIDALSMRALSEHAGISVPTIYSLIGGRDDVLAAVLDRAAVLFGASVDLMPDDPVERCLAAADLLVANLVENGLVARSVIAAGLGPSIGRRESAGPNLLASVVHTAVSDGVQSGVFAPYASPELVAGHVASLVGAGTYDWATSDIADEVYRLRVDHALLSVLAGIIDDGRRDEFVGRIIGIQAALADIEGTHR